MYRSRDRQVKVNQSYIDELLDENERLRKGDRNVQEGDTTSHNPPPTPGPPAADNGEAVRNPLLEERPWFVTLTTLELPIHVGEAADAAFATRFRQALSDVPVDHIPRADYATDRDLLMLSEADCTWPSSARANFLLETSLHSVCQCYHIVRKSTIRRDWDVALRLESSHDSLVICRLWALFALGVLFSTKVPSHGHRFPGLAYFAQASKLIGIVSERPRIEHMEVLLLLSLYSFYLNRRHTAYYLTGSAVRIGVILGLHLNIPEVYSIDLATREHLKRLWWTAYIFDRMWASKMGHPVLIHDDDIEVERPSLISGVQDQEDFGDHEYLVASIQLAEVAGRMAASIYGRRMQQGSFSQRVQHSMKELTNWIELLPDHLQIKIGSTSKTAPDAVISLHLLFNQCVILATRPVLIHSLRKYAGICSTDVTSSSQPIPETASALAEACIRCARHSHYLLVRAWISGSFFVFDYFYTQFLFSTTTVLAISSLLKGKDSRTDGEDFEIAIGLLGELKQNGNFAALEFCRHIDAIKHSQEQFLRKIEAIAVDEGTISTGPLRTTVSSGNTNVASLVTAGMALTEPSLQEFLAQPDLDFSFMYNDAPQDTFLPGVNGQYWMTG